MTKARLKKQPRNRRDKSKANAARTLPEQPTDPDDFDAKEWVLAQPLPLVLARGRLGRLKERLAQVGFEQVEITYQPTPDLWRTTMRVGIINPPPTAEGVERILGNIAEEIDCQISRGEVVAVVLGAEIAATFKLRTRATKGLSAVRD